MSHNVLKEADRRDQQLTDLTCLRKAAERLGGVWHEGQAHYKSWESSHHASMGTVPEGFTKEDITNGNCLHAISTGKAGDYEVGVVASRKFPGTFSLMFDTYDGKLEPKFGAGLGKLTSAYNAEIVKKIARLRGDTIKEQVLASGAIQVRVNTTARLGV